MFHHLSLHTLSTNTRKNNNNDAISNNEIPSPNHVIDKRWMLASKHMTTTKSIGRFKIVITRLALVQNNNSPKYPMDWQ